MSMQVCEDMCAGMCVDMGVHMRVNMGIDMQVGVCGCADYRLCHGHRYAHVIGVSIDTFIYGSVDFVARVYRSRSSFS